MWSNQPTLEFMMKKNEVDPRTYCVFVRVVNGYFEVSQPDIGIIKAHKRFDEIKSSEEIGAMILDVYNEALKRAFKMKAEGKEMPAPYKPHVVDHWISSKEASNILGVSDSTVRRLCDSGELGFVRTRGGHRKFRYEQVVSFQKRLYEHAPPPPTHKMERVQLYQVWYAMKDRCCNPSHPAYVYYGARGIKVSDRWMESFDHFCQDMGPRPYKMTLDRINNDGDYELSNCRWADQKTQQNNKRPRKKKTNNDMEMEFPFLKEEPQRVNQLLESHGKTDLTLADFLISPEAFIDQAPNSISVADSTNF